MGYPRALPMSISQEEAMITALYGMDLAKHGDDHIQVTIQALYAKGWESPSSAAYKNTKTNVEIKIRPGSAGEGIEMHFLPPSKFNSVFKPRNHMYCDLEYYGHGGHHCISASIVPFNDRRAIPAHIVLTVPSTRYADMRQIIQLVSQPLVL